MKELLCCFIFTLFVTPIFGQEDDTLFLKKTQEIEEVSISAYGKIVFEAPSIYLLDFHVDDKGKYLLLKGRKDYFISKLDEKLEMKSTYLLNFKPDRLFRDCLGALQVLSKDSIYKVDEVSEEIGVYEPNPMSFFLDYYAYCEAETENHLVYKNYSNSNQVVTFNAKRKEFPLERTIYKTMDTIQVLVANDWEMNVRRDNYQFQDQMGEIGISSLHRNRRKFQRKMFYEMVISKPDYTPLFRTKDAVYIFDHYTDSLVQFSSKSFTPKKSIAIKYQLNKGWQKEILFDKATQIFYTTFFLNGNLYISELAPGDFSIVKSIKINENVFNKHMMVYDGYVYYDFKKTRDAAYNKLFRQKL